MRQKFTAYASTETETSDSVVEFPNKTFSLYSLYR